MDYYWDTASTDTQRVFFERQLELAASVHLPVSIHDREAHQDIIETLRRFKDLGVQGVLHAFSGDAAMVREALDLRFMISFAGPITFLNARKAAELVPLVPLDRVMIETDSPYLSPHPLRGRRNEPANVALVAERLAALTARTVEQVAEHTTSNARALFGL